MNPHRDVMRSCWRHRFAAGRNRAARCPGRWHGKFVDVMVWRPDPEDVAAVEEWRSLAFDERRRVE
mgnify:CR=1 FL=1